MMSEIDAARAGPPVAVGLDTQDRVSNRLNDLQGWWADHDLLVTPTMRRLPWPHGGPAVANAGPFALPFSLTGQPVLAAPVHVHDGLPVGVQIVARQDRDEDLLALAAQLEAVTRWDTRLRAMPSEVTSARSKENDQTL